MLWLGWPGQGSGQAARESHVKTCALSKMRVGCMAVSDMASPCLSPFVMGFWTGLSRLQDPKLGWETVKKEPVWG